VRSEPSLERRRRRGSQRKVRVLVVDDNRDTAISCAQLVRRLGHEVETAHDGPAALQRARDFRPEVLFLDIGLPGMNGYDVARTLRQEGFEQETLVAISGYGQSEDRQRSHDAGFDHHLVKPVAPDALVSILDRVGDREPVTS
jgi:CheY-like chemotaxis protein